MKSSNRHARVLPISNCSVTLMNQLLADDQLLIYVADAPSSRYLCLEPLISINLGYFYPSNGSSKYLCWGTFTILDRGRVWVALTEGLGGLDGGSG